QTIIQCLDEIQALERKQPALTGDVLVFLPTERDIREVQRALSKLDFAHTEFLPLYSRLGNKDQQKIFQKGRGRRVVLSTNVAETSLTVPNIRYVIDSGTARMSRYSYKTKVQRLPIEPISQASANQRKGRCGRIMEGLCFRLYSEEDFHARPEYTDPEIRRTNLASVILQMLSLGLGSIEDFPFLDAPDPRFIRDGYQLLEELQALKGNGKLSQIGQRLAHLPMEPRFARMLVEAERLGCLNAVLIIVAGLSIQDPRDRPTEFAQQADDKHQAFRHESSDFLSYIKLWERVEKERQSLSQNQLRKWCKTYFLSYQRLREWRDNVQQLQSLLKAPTKTSGESTSTKKTRDQSNDTADFIHQAVLSGLLTQVLQQTENKGEYLAVRGKKVGLWPGSVRFKTGAAWLVAAQLLETQKVYAHTLAEVKPGWIEQLGRHMLSLSNQDMFWHAQRGKVIAKEKGSLLGLVIYADKSVDYGKIDPKGARQVFIEQALAPNALSGFGFVEHNQQVLHELEEMEAKLRRRGELLQESQLAQYFDERLPESVWDLKTLRFALEKQPKLAEQLKLEKAWFIKQAGILPDEALFPKHIHYADQRFELSYQLDPSTVEDGAMVHVPNVLLNQLSEADLSWVVPGFLEEKVLFLIKALPKQIRRQFVPAKDYARAIYDRLVAEQRPANQHLHEAVAKALGKMAGKTFASELWQDVMLPSHLLMTVAVTNAKGKILKVSNDLESLQSQFSQTASRFLAQQDEPIIGRKAKQWVFGDLPETVDKRHGKMTITSYVALIDQRSQVEVMLLDQAAQARWKMRLGLRRLFYLVHQKTLKGLEKQLPDFSALGLLYSRVGEASYLYESLCLAACEATFLAPDQPLIYTEQEFLARSAQKKSQLFEQLKRLCASLYQALKSHHALKKQLSRAPALLDPVVEDIELVFDELLAKDFLLKADPQALMHYGRYFQACELRWKNLQGNLSRDQREMATLDDLHDQLNEQLERLELPEGELRLPMYWQLQELRVQSFAQQLGTAQPVSAKKIQQAIKKL
ncbi:MAG: ATP-dependent RNA helicase HrpA, partial [Pseudomonadota bacterium]|nr:ATP-dependent RNA helicase HrpA [Pseudomonadota bacterium]